MKCAIIDDEYLARQYLCDYVKRIPFLELVGDYNSPLPLINEIKNGEIDLLFLDIKMPDINGIDFLKSLEKRPKVILTTAFKEYAIDGYELNVDDYLLKPISFNRFLQAVNKLVPENKSEQIKEENHKQTDFQEHHIIVRADRKYYKINYNDLLFIEGQKAYVTFHEEKRRITALTSLKELEEKLPKEKFIRVHKSFIVATKHIQELDGNMLLASNVSIPVGKIYKKDINKLFGI